MRHATAGAFEGTTSERDVGFFSQQIVFVARRHEKTVDEVGPADSAPWAVVKHRQNTE